MLVYRQIEKIIQTQKEKSPIIAVTGPRQSGKTTMLKKLFSNYTYSNSFDVFEIKATTTIIPDLFRQMDKFEGIASPEKVNKTLIYGSNENQQRSKYQIVSWRNIQEF